MYEKSYKSRILKEDPKTIKKKRRMFRLKKILWTVGSLVILIGIVLMLRASPLQVRNVEVVGTTVLDVADIQEYVRETLEGNYLRILPKSSIFLLNETGLEKRIQKQFSRIETIKVRRANFHTLSITIHEFDAKYLWCSMQEECYFMDEQGLVYSKAPVFSGSAYPKVYTEVASNTVPFEGVKTENLVRIDTWQQRLSEIGITPTTYRFISPRNVTIEFLHNKDYTTLFIDPSIDTDASLEYLFSGLRAEPFASAFRSPDKKLMYIDLRFEGKVIYKFQEQ